MKRKAGKAKGARKRSARDLGAKQAATVKGGAVDYVNPIPYKIEFEYKPPVKVREIDYKY